jgi:hypothetical protein
MLTLEPLQGLENDGGAELIDGAERSTEPWGKAEAKDGADISVHRPPQDPFLEAIRGLIQESMKEPLLNDLGRNRLLPGALGQQPIDR